MGLSWGLHVLLRAPALRQTFRRKTAGCRKRQAAFFFLSPNGAYIPQGKRGGGVSRSRSSFFLSSVSVFSVPPDSLREPASVTEARGDQMGTFCEQGSCREEGEGA